MQNALMVNQLFFSYENSAEPIFSNISLQIHNGWTGIAGPNGSGKTTLVKLLTGGLSPTSGSVSLSGSAVYCEQRTDDLPAHHHILFESTDKQVFRIRNMLGIGDDWPHRWHSLSHGERKRLQIGVALAQFPQVLAVDEPTNHLDRAAVQVLFDALKTFNGIGLLISHDRQLLDDLCAHTLFIDPPQVELFKCNFSTARLERERSAHNIRNERDKVRKEVKRLHKRAVQQRAEADLADVKRSKRGIAKKDHDAKRKMDHARLTGKDAMAGRLYERLNARVSRQQEKLDAIKVKKEHIGGIRIDAGIHAHRFPLIIPQTQLNMGESKILLVPERIINDGERIGIAGNNGSGKSTFIRYLMRLNLLPRDLVLYIPQEIDKDASIELLHWVKLLDNRDKGQLLTVMRRLGSDPDRVLASELPSPGEVRKLMLARGMMREPALIIMDEPTNHMDLYSMEHIEQALVDCACALLLVSHDPVFLTHTVDYLWFFQRRDEQSFDITGQYM